MGKVCYATKRWKKMEKELEMSIFERKEREREREIIPLGNNEF